MGISLPMIPEALMAMLACARIRAAHSEIRFTEALPKTRSSKIRRRLLRQLAAGPGISGDTSTLEDLGVLERLRQGV